jgi:hypothetical protein
MQKILFYSNLFLLMGCFNQPQRDCPSIKSGQFSFTFAIEKVEETSIFKRDENFQIETFRGKTDTSTVRWINDCEFVLEKLHPKSIKDRKKIHIKIIETTNEGYYFNYGFVGDGVQSKGFAKRIN